MSMDEGDIDDAWDRIGGPAPEGDGDGGDGIDEEQLAAQLGPPIRATFVIKADKVPVAPWPQEWRVGSLGPQDGHVTLVAEHDMEASPVAQLSAITGILGTLKQAQLEIAWWAIQTRGPLGDEEAEDMDAALQRMLEGDGSDAPAGPDGD